MRFQLTDLEYKLEGKGTKTQLKPFYLNENYERNIEEFVQLISSYEGKRKKELIIEELVHSLPTEKIAKSLFSSLQRYFSYEEQSVVELLKPEEKVEEPVIEVKTKTSVTDLESFIKQKNKKVEYSIKQWSPEKLRKEIYEQVNKDYCGFITKKQRKIFLESLSNNLSIPVDNVNILMYNDLDTEKILRKKNEFDVHELTKYYNYDAIDTILSYAISIVIETEKLSGTLAKQIVYVSRKNYVFTEIKKEKNGYRCIIEPPLEVYRDKNEWGRNLAEVALFILRKLKRDDTSFKLNSVIQIRKSKYLFTLDSISLPILPTFKRKDDESYKSDIDSKIEEFFSKSWTKIQGWEAIAEPEPILIGEKMFIPDFKLVRGEQEVYLEIVGYYTTKYITKKKKKMEELKKISLPIMYLVDINLKNHFFDMRDVDLLYYEKERIAITEVIKLLNKKYSNFTERVSNIAEEVKNILDDKKETTFSLTITEINNQIGTFSTEEVTKVLKLPEISIYLSNNHMTFIPSFGIVSNTIVEKIDDKLQELKETTLETLKHYFNQFSDAVLPICQHLNAKIQWKSIDELTIKYRK